MIESLVSREEEAMQNKRNKVKSTAFSDFVRHSSSKEKRKFFDKIVRETIKEQQDMLTKAEQTAKCQ